MSSKELGIAFNQADDDWWLMSCLLLIRVKWPFHYHNSNNWSPKLDPLNGWASPHIFRSHMCQLLCETTGLLALTCWGLAEASSFGPLEAIFVYLATKCCKFLDICMSQYIQCTSSLSRFANTIATHFLSGLFQLDQLDILQHLTASHSISPFRCRELRQQQPWFAFLTLDISSCKAAQLVSHWMGWSGWRKQTCNDLRSTEKLFHIVPHSSTVADWQIQESANRFFTGNRINRFYFM